jgi:carbon storage regulator
MLVLSRRVEESVQLGESIVMRILSIRGDQVRLGFTAPRDVRILRTELLRLSSQHIADAASDSHFKSGSNIHHASKPSR